LDERSWEATPEWRFSANAENPVLAWLIRYLTKNHDAGNQRELLSADAALEVVMGTTR
jgi:hypothetical protein